MSLKAIFLVLFILLSTTLTEAQSSSSAQTYTSDDGTLTFQYPQEWFVEVVDHFGSDSSIVVDNFPLEERFENPDAISIQFSLPQPRFDFGAIETPYEAVEQSIRAGAYVGGEIDIVTPSSSGTPQPLEVEPSTLHVEDLEVEGRLGAYGYVVMRLEAMNLDASQLVFFLDLGNDYWVSGHVSSFAGGLEAIQAHEGEVLSILRTIRFMPPLAEFSGNPDLPNVFSGTVGIWQRGTIEFLYPADWIVIDNIILLLSNDPVRNVNQPDPTQGQVIAAIQGVSETRAAVDPSELMNQCGAPSDWTARELVSELLARITPEQLEQTQAMGISITQPEAVSVNGVEIVYYREYREDIESLLMFVDLGNGNIPLMIALTRRGEMAQFEEQLFNIASTFQYSPVPC